MMIARSGRAACDTHFSTTLLHKRISSLEQHIYKHTEQVAFTEIYLSPPTSGNIEIACQECK